MSLDTIAIVGTTFLAGVIAPLIVDWIRRRRKKGYSEMRHKDIPLWVTNRIYKRGFPNKTSGITQSKFHLKGKYYEYAVVVKDPTIDEPNVKVGHLKVFRRKMVK